MAETNWADLSWAPMGAGVIKLAEPHAPADRLHGETVDGVTAWLRVGDQGAIVHHFKGYPRHRCPDHRDAPDCICGGGECADNCEPDCDCHEDGWVSASNASAVVAWQTREGPKIRRVIHREDEGVRWNKAIGEEQSCE